MDSALPDLWRLDLSGQGHYLHWGLVQVSYANATVIVLMILVFVLALVVPFPGGRPAPVAGSQDRPVPPPEEARS